MNLLTAVALLVWRTHLIQSSMLRVFGAKLRNLLAHSVGNRWTAALQSSTATALIVSSFVGQGLVTLPLAATTNEGSTHG